MIIEVLERAIFLLSCFAGQFLGFFGVTVVTNELLNVVSSTVDGYR